MITKIDKVLDLCCCGVSQIYGSLELKPPLTRDWKIRRPHHSPKITYPVRLPGF